MLDWQGRGGFGCWVWEGSNGEVLGWQSLMPCRNNPAITDTMAEASMYVRRDSWGKGIGTKLLQHALAVADRTCIEHVMGVVSSQNDPMLRVATRLGFHVLGELAPSPKAPYRGALTVLFYRCDDCQDEGDATPVQESHEATHLHVFRSTDFSPHLEGVSQDRVV